MTAILYLKEELNKETNPNASPLHEIGWYHLKLALYKFVKFQYLVKCINKYY